MTKARSNAVANAAKGDLTVGNGTNLSGILAVGSNGDTLVADSSTSTGLRYQTSANENACINGGMDIWQRGTSFTIALGVPQYTADRWTNYFNNTGTIAQETTLKPDTSTFSLKITNTATSADNAIFQLVEQQQMEQFRGKTVTLSVKLAGTVGLSPSITLAYSTTANDTLFNTNTQISAGSTINPAINASTFVTRALTFTVPTTAKQLRIGIGTGSVVNTNVLYVAEVQLELGSVATTFKKSGGTIQGELAACQRYFSRFASGADGTNEPVSIGQVYGTGGAAYNFQMIVPMRTTPTMTISSAGHFSTWSSTAIDQVCTGFSIAGTQSSNRHLRADCSVASGLVPGNATYLRVTNSSATLDLSAEL
jgi:hypothetical protein